MQAQGQLSQARIKAAEAQAVLGEDQRALDEATKNLPQDSDALRKAQIEAAQTEKASSTVNIQPAPSFPTEPAPVDRKFKLESVKGPIAASPPPKPLQVDFISLTQVIQKIMIAERPCRRPSAVWPGLHLRKCDGDSDPHFH